MECSQCLRTRYRGYYHGTQWWCRKCYLRYITRTPMAAEDGDTEFLEYLISTEGFGLQLTTEVREAIRDHLKRGQKEAACG